MIKDRCEQLKECGEYVDELIDRYNTLKSFAVNPYCSRLDEVKVRTSKQNQSESMFIKLADLSDQINKASCEYAEQYAQVMERLKPLEKSYECGYSLMVYRYIIGMTWEQIAEQMNMSVRKCLCHAW